jgi:hypothetical protein
VVLPTVRRASQLQRSRLNPGVLNKGLGFDRPPRLGAHRTGRKLPAMPVPGSLLGARFLASLPGGPNAAHPRTQTVSNSLYLRPEAGDGKQVAEKPEKVALCEVR